VTNEETKSFYAILPGRGRTSDFKKVCLDAEAKDAQVPANGVDAYKLIVLSKKAKFSWLDVLKAFAFRWATAKQI
jgi:hypothetical protein